MAKIGGFRNQVSSISEIKDRIDAVDEHEHQHEHQHQNRSISSVVQKNTTVSDTRGPESLNCVTIARYINICMMRRFG